MGIYIYLLNRNNDKVKSLSAVTSHVLSLENNNIHGNYFRHDIYFYNPQMK